MKNIQVTVDEETLRRVDRLSKTLELTRSEIVCQALRQWLQRRAKDRFEADWIAAVRREPGPGTEADDWRSAQAWSRR